MICFRAAYEYESGSSTICDPQQLEIMKAVEARFESTLFDIRQLVQADLFHGLLERWLVLL